jgi:FkbM family methyltransferase
MKTGAERLLRQRIEEVGDGFTFLQLGGCDGTSFDPINQIVREYKLRGVVLEPLPHLFSRLRYVYDGSRVRCIQAAAHRQQWWAEMYYVDPSWGDAPEWAKGIGSLNPMHHQKSGIPMQHIRTARVPCLTLREVYFLARLQRVDLIVTDCEGYDAEIVRMIDWHLMSPFMVHVEHRLGENVMALGDFLEVCGRFEAQGMGLIIEEHDLIGYKL